MYLEECHLLLKFCGLCCPFICYSLKKEETNISVYMFNIYANNSTTIKIASNGEPKQSYMMMPVNLLLLFVNIL